MNRGSLLLASLALAVSGVTAARAQIIDWTYIDSAEEKMHGNYTLCALLSQEPGVDADRLKQAYKLDCEL